MTSTLEAAREWLSGWISSAYKTCDEGIVRTPKTEAMNDLAALIERREREARIEALQWMLRQVIHKKLRAEITAELECLKAEGGSDVVTAAIKRLEEGNG